MEYKEFTASNNLKGSLICEMHKGQKGYILELEKICKENIENTYEIISILKKELHSKEKYSVKDLIERHLFFREYGIEFYNILMDLNDDEIDDFTNKITRWFTSFNNLGLYECGEALEERVCRLYNHDIIKN